MSTVDSESMGRRIAEARARAGLTQADLASQIAMDRSALAKIENGSRRVSALELAKIAEIVRERIEWFVTEAPSAIVSHRNLQEPGVENPAIDRTIERIAWDIEFIVERDSQLPLVALPTLRKPASVADAERAALKVRGLLGLDGREPLLNPSSSVGRLGLLAFSLDLGSESADAASILLKNGAVALVNGHLRVGRRRLALVHELGHCLFADEYTVDWRITGSDGDATWEALLDRFARSVLLPQEGVVEFWAALRSKGDDLRAAAVKTASKFRVDMSTLARRLHEMGITDSSESSRVRDVRTTRSDIVEFDLVVADELAAPSIPRMYAESVVRLYRQEVLSAARALDLLLDTWDEEDLPELPMLPEGRVWDFV